MPTLPNRQPLIHTEEDEAFMAVTTGMMGLTNTIEQSLMAFLNRRLNFEVAKIEVWHNVLNEKTEVGIRFKNGHALKTDTEHVKTEEFLATCVMVYDLPPKR